MPEFIADTDGTVNGLTFADCSAIFQGYIEAMFFTENAPGVSMTEWPEDTSDLREGTIPEDAGFGDIHPETLEKMQMDCFNFEVKARPLLEQAYQRNYDARQAGHDFWLTRNGHGAGFWDRDVLSSTGEKWSGGNDHDGETLGEKLTEIAQSFGETWADFVPNESSPTGYGYVYLS
jgi:hypothetical protein